MRWPRFYPVAPLLMVALACLAAWPCPAAGQAQIAGQPGPRAASGTAAKPEADPRKARQAYQDGLRAERDGNWDEAFQDFSQAAEASPNDRNIKLQQEFARSEVVRDLTGQAEKQILTGENDQARASLAAALRLDPTYSVARERLAQITAPSGPATASPAVAENAEPQFAIGPPKLQTRPGLHNFDYRGTTRGAYQAVAQQFGVTAAFDADLIDRTIRFTVPEMDFETAMRVLGEETSTFYRSVDSTTFFVAADTTDKRRNYDPEVTQLIVLPASETNDEMTETSRVVRDIVGLRRSELDFQTHTMTVRDTLQNVALAKALVEEMEKPHGEALLDIDILEVDSQLARNMGITPPASATVFTLSSAQVRQLEAAPNIGTLDSILATIFGGQSALAGASSALVPPLIAFGGGKTVFFATLPSAMAQLQQTLSVVRTAQRVLLRVEDGLQATFFVGEHFPITLALLSESLVSPESQLTSAAVTGSFPVVNYDVGHNPTGVAIGDFNGDGIPDLAVVNQTDNTVSILLGTGSGQFGAATTFPTGKAPTAIVAGDFNGDGKLDLAVANNCTVNATVADPCAPDDYSVSILQGNGDGTFAAPVNYTVGTSPVALVTGNFNSKNDGHLDLAVVNQGSNTVSVLVGVGDGTFMPKQDFAVGNMPSAIASGDFNNDGHLDLAVTNRADNDFSVLLGNGDGTFGAQTDFTTGKGPSAIASADFDGDGHQDVAVTNFTDNTVEIILGKGDGTFGATNTFATGTGPSALIAADFNLDLHPDLIVANQSADSISVFLGLGDGTLLTPITISTPNGPVAMAESDLNNDGLPDLAVVNQSSGNVSVILNTASLPSSSSAPLTAYPGSEYVDLGLKVKASPRMHPDDEVTLDLDFEISALAGGNVNGIPILSNRTIQQTVRLRENETSLLSGIIQSDEAGTVTGLPGLAEAGPLGYLAGVRGKQKSETELVITITPRQLRLASRTDNSLYAGRGQGSETAAAPAGLLGNPLGTPPQPQPGVIPPPGLPGAPPPSVTPPTAAPPVATPPQGQPPPAPPQGPLLGTQQPDVNQ